VLKGVWRGKKKNRCEYLQELVMGECGSMPSPLPSCLFLLFSSYGVRSFGLTSKAKHITPPPSLLLKEGTFLSTLSWTVGRKTKPSSLYKVVTHSNSTLVDVFHRDREGEWVRVGRLEGEWKRFSTGEGLVVLSKVVTTVVRARGWEFTATRRRIDNSVSPLKWKLEWKARWTRKNFPPPCHDDGGRCVSRNM
jgi:hypothetical protein